MRRSNRYLVYSTKTHSYLRGMLILLVLFVFYVAVQLGYLWLYGVCVILLILAVSFLSVLYSHVSFSERGIKLRYGFWKTYELRWEEILCCGRFSLTILGASAMEEYMYFSKKPVAYSQLAASNTLPSPSDDFIFLSKQEKALRSVMQFWKSEKGKCLGENTSRQEQKKRNPAIFYVVLGVSAVICGIAYALSSDARWIFAAAAAIVVLFALGRPKQ